MEFFDLIYLRKNGIPRVDYHSHTYYTDGEGTPQEYAKSASEKGLKSIAITEHIWKTSDWLDDFLREIRETNKDTGVSVIPGVEAKQISIDGEIDVKKTAAKKVELVLGSVHAYPTENAYEFIDPKLLKPRQALELETEAMLALAENKLVDVIAHPFVLYKKHFNESEIPGEYAEKVIMAAIENDVALEFNGKYSIPSERFLKTALRLGAKISLGSDAHKPREIGNIPLSTLKKVLEDL